MSGCGGCKTCSPKDATRIKDAKYTIALAGNANVGKSVTFNQLTGVDQIIGNSREDGERAEGLLQYKGHRRGDRPSRIYSFSTYLDRGAGDAGLSRWTPGCGRQRDRCLRTGAQPLLYHPAHGTGAPAHGCRQPNDLTKEGDHLDVGKLTGSWRTCCSHGRYQG